MAAAKPKVKPVSKGPAPAPRQKAQMNRLAELMTAKALKK
jgi:hypothetical protein